MEMYSTVSPVLKNHAFWQWTLPQKTSKQTPHHKSTKSTLQITKCYDDDFYVSWFLVILIGLQRTISKKRIRRSWRRFPGSRPGILAQSNEESQHLFHDLLDGLLASAGVCADEFFHCLPSESVNVEQIKSALCSCKVSLDENQILDMFCDLCLELTTSDGSSITNVIAVKDLYKYRRLYHKFVAPEGSLWKMYACPYKQELLFHNIDTNEKIYESSVRKKYVQRIVKENLRSSELMKVKNNDVP
jgi:hypothetical protein